MNTSPRVNYISLGDNCTTARQLKRLNVRRAAYPFDQAFSDHRMVVRALLTDFDSVFSGDVIIRCHLTGFHWAHQPGADLSPRLLDRFARRVQRLRSLREEGPVCFIRYIGRHSAERDRDHVADHAELREALRSFGFFDFRLVYATAEHVDHPDFIDMSGELPDREPWLGNNADWDRLMSQIS